VKRYEILDDQGRVLAAADDQHHSIVHHQLAEPVTTKNLKVRIHETWGAPAAVFEIRCTA